MNCLVRIEYGRGEQFARLIRVNSRSRSTIFRWWLLHLLLLTLPASLQAQFTNEFSFTISWAAHDSVIVEACTDLVHPSWLPLGTNSLSTGSGYFSDFDWTNYPARFYRIHSP